MSQQVLTFQAALIYAAPPVFEAEELLSSLNSALVAMGHVPMTLGPMSSDQFVLFSQPKLHATIAVHRAPLGTQGLERALNSARNSKHGFEFQPALEKKRAHVVITVGEGDTPLPFDPPEPVDARTKLETLFRLIRFVTAEARPVAAHFCTSDRLYTPEELDKALTRTLPMSLLVHPSEVRVDQRAGGQTGTSLIAHQSHHLLGKTLIVEGLPVNVPRKLGQQLVDGLLTKYLEGELPLAEGDRIRKNEDITLYVRHVEPVNACPNGAIVVSFWSEPPRANYLDRQPAFEGHHGYNALAQKPRDTESVSDFAGAEDWDADYISSIGATSSQRKSGPPVWMILVAVGVFLWVGLPLLNVPQTLIESTFSEGLLSPSSN
ncbi:MAG: hypothetical protein AB3N13_14205 [Arenibacterium sp.]